MIASLCLSGCGGSLFSYKGDRVDRMDLMVPLLDGNQEGEWKTSELSVKYRYQKTPDGLKIGGTTALAGGLGTGFTYISHLAVYLLLLDDQGVVIENTLVYAGENNLSFPTPMEFEKTIPMPDGVRKISFAYDGDLDGTYDIWYRPARQ